MLNACSRCLWKLKKGGKHLYLRFLSSSTESADVSIKSTTNGILQGIRILDLSRVLAGPYCTMILGDMGAEIIKVEKPGDDTRSWGPPFCGPESVYFLTVNRNKKSVTIDIRKREGQNLIKRLAQSCDALVENYIPGKLGSYGLGYDDIKKVAPSLVYCSISGYGQTGPYAKRAGYDVIVSGVAGLMHITGPKDGEPCKVGVAMTDLSTGLYAHGAILAAIINRQKTGQGQHIDCNLFSTQVASLINIGSNYLNVGIEATRHGTAHPSIVPYQAFKTEDSYFLVGAGNDQQFIKLCQVLNRDDLAVADEYKDNASRVKNREMLLNILGDIFKSRNTKEWVNIFEDSGIPYGPINNMEAVYSDPQAIHNGMIQSFHHPMAGNIRVPGPAVKYSGEGTIDPTSPPTLGQHTDTVLRDVLGLDDKELDELRRTNVI
ncbi:hypothetical protein FSP39_005177 [Pinctada imbricata]|uniref:Succinate--hydroxymethylglutarate CoA-transferase n=1 Tax=Pinctada imbricata TaxID=66713 RepID=A0AA88YUV9_PINIB|nr:hypothetical protein FSP39_005177 [Pinctada imbricata]